MTNVALNAAPSPLSQPRRDLILKTHKKNMAEYPVKKLRVFFIPFFASGHMIPMADLAVLFSRHPDVDPTLCLTPANAAFLRTTLDPAVNVLLYPFPSKAVGLPSGQENLSSVTPDEEHKIYMAVDLSEHEHRRILQEHRPDVVIADVPFWWTTSIARDLGVPRITWHAVGVFPQLVMNSLFKYRDEIMGTEGDVIIKDLPGSNLKMPVSELPEFVRSSNFFAEAWHNMKKAQLEGYGVIVNTFYKIEQAYCDQYRMTDGKRAWFVGPVALARGHAKVVAEEGQECLKWLDGRAEGSVVFVCYGSWCQFKNEQLKAIAIGLEKSGQPFLWVVREGDCMPDDSWESRVKDKGKVVIGWAPQVAILGHKAIGAFLTHCGWNSVLEAAAAGVPMLTWPLVFEQFINERLVVEVVGMGERVFKGYRSTREEEKVVVPAEAIAKAVSEFMEREGGEGRRRTEARKCAAMARAAVEGGGSSRNDLARLVDELKVLRDERLMKM